MAGKQLSYDYQNKVRDLSGVFGQVFASLPFLISLIKTEGAAKSTRHEWLEDEVSDQFFQISAASPGETTLTVTGSSGTQDVIPGTVFRLEAPDGSHMMEQVKLVSTTHPNQLEVQRSYGGTGQAEIQDGTKLVPVARPLNEATDPEPRVGREPDVNYNYTQIFDRTAKVSKTAQAIKLYGIEHALNYQVQIKMRELTREMNSQVIYGRRVNRDGLKEGSFGGILQYLQNGITESTGGAISSTILNNVFEAIFAAGGMSQRYAICVAPNQARRISAFMTAGNVPVGTKITDTGFAVNKFRGDIPAFSGNPYEAFIAVDPNLPKDRLLVVDLDKLNLIPLEGRTWTDLDASPNGADYFARRILGEYTFEIKNGKTCHGQAVGLEV